MYENGKNYSRYNDCVGNVTEILSSLVLIPYELF